MVIRQTKIGGEQEGGDKNMYIPEFWCGFILGVIVSAILLIAFIICIARKLKK